MHIVFVHGFNSSSRSFNYLISQLPDHDIVAINYDSHQPLQASIDACQKLLPKGPFYIVGHSLGGVIAAHLASENEATKLITISSPLAGSRAAMTLKWLPGHPKVMHDITPSAPIIMGLAARKLSLPTLSIVSTGGHLSTSNEPNDSVVTVSSQKGLKYGRKVEVKANHFEVLLHEKTVKHVNDFLFGEAA